MRGFIYGLLVAVFMVCLIWVFGFDAFIIIGVIAMVDWLVDSICEIDKGRRDST